jgi:hypothetical protein
MVRAGMQAVALMDAGDTIVAGQLNAGSDRATPG